jgi:pyruvate dehydrogenase E1 component alpha subunit
MAEILGRATGLNSGRGGTIHLCDPALGFISTSGIVGGCISLGVGGGYACRQLGNGAVSTVFFGDGALEEGVSFEALNIASLWRLPVLFVCENNSTGSWAPGDGADAGAVHAAASDAIARCRAGQGPVFLETVTKRWPGNNPLWPEPVTGATDIRMATGEARSSGEHADWLENHDPVLRLGRLLAGQGAGAKARVVQLDGEARARIDKAVTFALGSPFPSADTAFEHVFA